MAWAKQITSAEDALAGENLLARIDSRLVEEYKQRLLNQGNFSPATINRKLSSLRKYLSWAASENLLETASLSVANPAPEPALEKAIPTKPASYGLAVEKESRKTYSSFPPIRLKQKISEAIILALDYSLIFPLAKAVNKLEYLAWKTKGRPVFKKMSGLKTQLSKIRNPKTTIDEMLNVVPVMKNLPKEFYAPLEISTKNFPWYKKAWFTARYTRPKWCKTYHSYPIVHYLHFAILIVFMAAIGFGFYNTFFQKGNQSPTLAAALPVAPPRVLSFQGRLTDNFDTPITSNKNLRFTIYTSPTATDSGTSIMLWQEVDNVLPDQNGIFNVILRQQQRYPIHSVFAKLGSIPGCDGRGDL